MKMWLCRTMGDDLQFIYGNIYEQPAYNELKGLWEAWEYDSQYNAYKVHGSWLNLELFPEVTFENSPMEVELVLKKYMKWIKVTEQLPPIGEEILIAMRNKNMCSDGIWLFDVCFYLGGNIHDNDNWEGKINWESPLYWCYIEEPE